MRFKKWLDFLIKLSILSKHLKLLISGQNRLLIVSNEIAF